MSKILFGDTTEADAVRVLRELLYIARITMRTVDEDARWPQTRTIIDLIEQCGIANPWTACADDLPDGEMLVLGYFPDADSDRVWPCYWDGEAWRDSDNLRVAPPPTHWTDFPSPPSASLNSQPSAPNPQSI